ncbi:hypothetical protein Poli38472_005328 [Pythium oligandrum]|uniref:Cytochrome P450 n=1 Tax=Pythium oligandrum TaxID=41045 RepID=A0A8K1CGC2_PYTOL|nr:hypothetical protein Poli38472_005328 [Pythium oligandrum]|eukprot:TMW62710.1 hypothetical protein Poli38472_005328 [Pythium oligandrum]
MVFQSLVGKLSDVSAAIEPTYAVCGLLLAPVALALMRSKFPALEDQKLLGVPPSTKPIVNNTVEFATRTDDFHDWLLSLCEHFQGQPFLLRTVGQPDMVVLYTTEAVEDVFKTHFERFPKGKYQCDTMRDMLGNGIFASDGATWSHQRKVGSNLFTARTLRDTMTQSIRKHAVVLRRILHEAGTQDKTIDIFKLFNRFTIEAFSEIGFGIEMKSMEAEEEHPFQTAFDRVQRTVMLRFVRPAWFWRSQRVLQVGAERQLREDVETIDRIVLDIIAQSFKLRQTNEHRNGPADIVSLFLDQYENSPESKNGDFDPQYLRDIVVNFLIAGRDTTAQALSWFFLNVTKHPHVVTKIRAEMKELLPELMAGTIDTPTMEHVQRLTYLEAAVKESLRLYPAVPFTVKWTKEDVVLSDGTLVRKGQLAAIPSYAYSRMQHVWGPDAATYNPGRWIDPATGKLINVSAFKFFAFNAGPRTCLGMNLALLEMKIVVASLLSRLNIEVIEPEKVTYDLSLTLPVRGELLTRITPYKAE